MPAAASCGGQENFMEDKEEKYKSHEDELVDNERWEILEQVESWLELPVVILGFFWLGLLLVELLWGLTPFLDAMFYLIWIVFLIDFFLRFFLAPKKLRFMKRNWLTALSLPLPALRLFQIFRFVQILRVVRVTRSFRMVQVVSSVNRGMRSLSRTMARRGFGYAMLLTLFVVLIGAAGIHTFERHVPGFDTYGNTLWWAVMVLTTIGPNFEPQTGEGRILAFLLSVYSIAVFSYITASLASFFVGQEADAEESRMVGVKTINELREEIAALRAELRNTNARSEGEQNS
jgi:voltage-gated potassium channel